MPVFTFKAVDSQARQVADEIEAASVEEATSLIKSKGYYPTEIKPKAAAPAPAAAPGPKKKKLVIGFGGVRNRDLVQFTTQLSILIDAGLPIVRSLQILETQAKPGVLKNVLMDVTADVEGGSSLSDSMSRHPRAFNSLYVNLVRAGEAGGVLDTIMERLAKFLEQGQRLRNKVRGAMVYPVVIGFIAFTIVSVLMVVVIPKFELVFSQQRTQLPLPTQFVISLSRWSMARIGFVREADSAIPKFRAINILISIFVVVAVIASFVFIRRTTWGRRSLDWLKINSPVIGPVSRKSVVTRFCRTLGTLVASGVSLLEALSVCRGTIGNVLLADAIDTVHDSIREGESVANPLRASGMFDEIVVNMVAVGEETGELDKMLLKVADSYDEEVDNAVTNLVRLMEPLFIVIMGVAVGGIVIALFLPMVAIMQQMGQQQR
jgi:type IV pilus assembly protein PilC